MKRFLLSLPLLLASMVAAYAQTEFASTNGKVAQGVLFMCLDSTGKAVPSVNSGNCIGADGYPPGATSVSASTVGTTAATTATMPAVSGKTNYVCGYSIRANATAAVNVTNTLTGILGGTLSSLMWVSPVASGIGVDEPTFSPCLPASAVNIALSAVSGAPGAGGAVTSRIWGYVR